MAQIIEEDILQIKNEIQFFASGSSNTVTLAAPTSLSTNVIFPLPSNNPNPGDVYVFSTGGGEWSFNNSQVQLETYIIKDVKSSGTNGGTFTSGAWRTRDLNTLTTFPSGGTNVTLSSNQLTISPGTYSIYSKAPGNRIDNHQTRFRNISNNTTTLVGSSEMSDDQKVDTSSIINDIFTVSTQSVYELQHRCSRTDNNNGFGTAVGFGENEIYSIVKLVKLS